MRRRNKDKERFQKLLRRMQTNLWVVYIVFCVLFVLLIARLMYIEYNSGDRYQKIVLSQQEYDSTLIPFKRGDIVDAKGTVLATSIDVYNIILDCKLVNANPDKAEQTFGRLAEFFPQVDVEEARRLVREEPKKQYTILTKHVSYDDMHRFMEVNNDKDEENDTAGIWFEKEYIRSYPYNSLAASLLGFTTSGNAGMIGLEIEYNDLLNGTNGRAYGYLNEDSDVEKTVIEPQNGNTVVTTLDINIQTIVEDEIAEFNRAYTRNDMPSAKNIGMLVMNPQTGGIYAMANFPTFNLNDPWELNGIYRQEDIDMMTSDEQMDALNRLWQNFCITSTYEPGSTFKPFTIATGLETGTLKGNEVYYCDGVEHIADYAIHCVKRDGHGQLDLKGALAQSCNDSLMQMSYVIGAHNFAEYQRLFGFGQRTGIDLPGEAMTNNLIYTEDELEVLVNRATNSFGQNFNTTMIQLGTGFASIINGGNLYEPYIVSHAIDETGNVVMKRDPVIMKKTISKETSEQMKEYLRAVVVEGSGGVGGVQGYDVGGKTGTAQKLPRTVGNYLVSYICYVPQDNPQLLMYTVVDTPNADDQAHSTFAMEMSHNVMVQILPYLGIMPTGAESPKSEAGKIPYGSATHMQTYTNGQPLPEGEEDQNLADQINAANAAANGGAANATTNNTNNAGTNNAPANSQNTQAPQEPQQPTPAPAPVVIPGATSDE